MSRIGKKPVIIPPSVQISYENGVIKCKGPKGELSFTHHPNVSMEIKDNQVLINVKTAEDKNLHGLSRTLVYNLIEGVTKGFEKKLEIQGVGYRAQLQGKKLVLSLGFSHPVEFTPPAGINIAIDEEKKNIIIVSGHDKQLVGEVAAKIKKFKKPEPYKGKGIRYLGEFIAKKAGKSAAKTSA